MQRMSQYANIFTAQSKLKVEEEILDYRLAKLEWIAHL